MNSTEYRMEPAEQEFDDAMRFGVKEVFNPSIDLKSLGEFMPAVPSATAHKPATVLQNLAALGTADHVGAPERLQSASYAEDLEANGIRFFADVGEKERVEEFLQQRRHDATVAESQAGVPEGEAPSTVARDTTPIIASAEEAIRKSITDKALAGQHEAMKQTSDPIATARMWHLRAETYTDKETNAFEKKLVSLLSKGGGGGKEGKKQPRA